VYLNLPKGAPERQHQIAASFNRAIASKNWQRMGLILEMVYMHLQLNANERRFVDECIKFVSRQCTEELMFLCDQREKATHESSRTKH
jgi:hypothetical protein